MKATKCYVLIGINAVEFPVVLFNIFLNIGIYVFYTENDYEVRF